MHHRRERAPSRRADHARDSRAPDARAEREQHPTDRPRGAELPAPSRALFEHGFGHSFGDVRVFADSAGHEVAAEHDARAVALGQDIYFARGAYAPDTERGHRLLAHELAHVVQQSRAPAGEAADDAGAAEYASLEAGAWAAGDRAAVGLTATVAAAPSAAMPQLSDEPNNPLDDNSWVSKALGVAGFVPGIGPYAKMARGGWEAAHSGANAADGDWGDTALAGAQALASTASGLAGLGGFSMFGTAGAMGALGTLGGAASAGGIGGVAGTIMPSLFGGAAGSAVLPGVAGMEAGAALAGGGASGLAAMGPAAAVVGAGLAGIGAGIGLDHGVDWIGDQITGNEQGDHSISAGIASLMTGTDQAAVSIGRSLGILDEDAPEYTQTLGWQLAEILPSWMQ